MASSVDVPFEEICRTCMGCSQEEKLLNPDSEIFSLKSIFDFVYDYKNRRVQISDILKYTVHQLPKIDINDEMPNNICTRCLEKLFAFYEFQNSCINSDLRLRNLINNSFPENSAVPSFENPTHQLKVDIDKSLQTFIKQENIIEAVNEDINNITEDKMSIGNYEIVDNTNTTSQGLHTTSSEETKATVFENSIAQNDYDEIVAKTVLQPYKQVWECKDCSQCFLNKRLMLSHLEDENSNCNATLKEKSSKRMSRPTEKQSKPTYVPAYSNVVGISEEFHDQAEIATVFEANIEETRQAEMENDEELPKSTNNDLPFKCTICNKGFKYNSRLLKHQLIHTTKDQLFFCSRCGEAFDEITDLTQHAQIHENEKRFKCHFCPRKFRTYGGAYSHQRKNHADEMQMVN